MLPRLHLFELEDQPWFPAAIRDLATDYLLFIQAKFGLHRPVVPLLAEALEETGADRVVDLCSGGGGPVLALRRALLAEGRRVSFTLTDRYPNLPAFHEAADGSSGEISFVSFPVDARSVPRELTGFRTLFNAFHHFHPTDAAAVLRDACRTGQPLAVFELTSRTPQMLLPMLLLTPVMVLLATPFIRPFRWRRLLWTYLLPLVPLTCWWDGIVSQLRAYTPGELEGLARDAADHGYAWRAGQVPLPSGPGALTYLICVPAPNPERPDPGRSLRGGDVKSDYR